MLAEDLGKPEPDIHIKDPGISFSVEAQTLITKVFNHILRNSMDHGIEGAELREKRGKSPSGQIYISLFTERQQLVIEYWDDGTGLNLERIAEKSIQQGIIEEDHQLSNSQLAQIVFHPDSQPETRSRIFQGEVLDLMR